jgi:hypothetical protein
VRHAGGWGHDAAGGTLEQPTRLVDLFVVGAEEDKSLSQSLNRQRQKPGGERAAGMAALDLVDVNLDESGTL